MAHPSDQPVSLRIGDNLAARQAGSSHEAGLQKLLYEDSYSCLLPGRGNGGLDQKSQDQMNLLFPDEVRDKKFYERENAENADKYLNRYLKGSGEGVTRSEIEEALKTKAMSMDERRAFSYMRDNFDSLSSGWMGGKYDPFRPVITQNSLRNGIAKHIHER
jgi:hypothetical protein